MNSGRAISTQTRRGKGDKMSKLAVWIADQMSAVALKLEAQAGKIYLRYIKNSIPSDYDFTTMYDFDDDETQRTSDEQDYGLELIVDLHAPSDALVEAMGYSPDELRAGAFRIMLPDDDAPNYDIDDELRDADERDELIDEDGR